MTQGSTGGYSIARSLNSIIAKAHFEVTLNATGATNLTIGICNASQSLDGVAAYVGSSANSIGLEQQGGSVLMGGSVVAAPNAGLVWTAPATVIVVEVDRPNNLITFRVGSTVTSSLSISSIIGPVYACASGFTSGDKFTFNFGASAWASAPTSGFAGF